MNFYPLINSIIKLRIAIVRRIKNVLARCLALLPVSSRVLGPPKGTYKSALDAVRGLGANLGKVVSERKPLEYVQPPVKSVEDITRYFQGRREYLHPYAASFPDGRVFGKEGITILPDDRVPLDTIPAFYVVVKHEKVGGLRVFRKLKLPSLQKVDGHLVNLALGETQNYSHWTFQNMTRLQLLKAAGINADFYYIDISREFQRDYLKIMGIPLDKVIPVSPNAHIEARKLTVVGGCSFNQVPYPDLLREVRETVLGPDSVASTRRIYISRADASYRKVANEDEVMSYLGPLGFERVIMTDFSVREQARLLQQAKVVISPHGANMTNIIFCQPGTYILEVFQPGWIDSGYTAPSAQLGLRYFYALGDVDESLLNAPIHDEMKSGCYFSAPYYRIKIESIKRFLSCIENNR